MKNIILLSLITIHLLHGETNTTEADKILAQKLFEKAFKKKSQIKEFYLPLRVNKIIQDEVFVKIDNRENILIGRETMEYIASLLKDEYKNKFQYTGLDKDEFAPLSALEQFEIKTSYNSKDIMIDIFLPVNLKKASLIKFNRGRARDINGSILPEDYSGGINLYMNKRYNKNNSDSFEGNPLNISSDITLNVHDFVVEGRVQYQGGEGEFTRGRFRLVKDDPDNHLRYTLGDITLPHHNRLSYQSTLGIGVEKIFNVGSNYNQNISRINSHEFFLQNKSRVEIYVNDRYQNSLTLIGGTHNLYDLNLPSGLNRVKLKIIEDGGKIEYLEFNDFSYSEVLQKGLARYGMGVGIESRLNNNRWEYEQDKKIASAYVEYGLFNSITVESGIQTAEDYLAGDLELLIGTNFGLFNPYLIASQTDVVRGYKQGVDYRTNIGSATLNLGYQDIGANYHTMSTSTTTKSTLYRGNLYSQIGFGISMGLSASQYIREEIEENKYGITLRKNIGKWSTQLNFDQIDKEGEESNQKIYLTLDYRFGQNSARYANYIDDDREQINLRHNSKGKYGLSTDFQYENSENTNSYNLRADMNDEKFRIDTTYNLRDNTDTDNQNQSFSLQLATGMVFAGDRATITSPISSSFVIVDNDDKLENPLGLMGYQKSDAFIYDSFVVDMSDYSERELTVDESELDFGIDLKNAQQKFITNYKSGLLMEIAVQNLFSVKGIFYDKATKEPLKYKAFKIFNTLTGERSNSFSNENGEFTINQVEVGKYNVTFVKERGYAGVARFSFEIKEDENQESLTDLGNIYIEMPKKKEAKKYLIYNKKSNKTIDETFSSILQNIYFDSNSYAISKKAKTKLDAIAIELKKQKNIKLDIIGHSDATDSKEYNMEISHRRATSVKSYLEEQGVKSSQLNALGSNESDKKIESKGQVKFQIR